MTLTTRRTRFDQNQMSTRQAGTKHCTHDPVSGVRGLTWGAEGYQAGKPATICPRHRDIIPQLGLGGRDPQIASPSTWWRQKPNRRLSCVQDAQGIVLLLRPKSVRHALAMTDVGVADTILPLPRPPSLTRSLTRPQNCALPVGKHTIRSCLLRHSPCPSAETSKNPQ